jgi:GNAT superfamily N-acetyltransferase
MKKVVLSLLCFLTLAPATPAQAWSWSDLIPKLAWCTAWLGKEKLQLQTYKKRLTQYQNNQITVAIQWDSDFETRYRADITDKITDKNLGFALFSYNKIEKIGNISLLYIEQKERGHSYGDTLLKFVLEKLNSDNCNKIYWVAEPFNLNPNQTREDMLPKLIAFYQRQGAQVISQNATSAEMSFYPKKINILKKKLMPLKLYAQMNQSKINSFLPMAWNIGDKPKYNLIKN